MKVFQVTFKVRGIESVKFIKALTNTQAIRELMRSIGQRDSVRFNLVDIKQIRLA